MEFNEMKDAEILKYLVDEVDGAIAAGFVSMDGLSMGAYNMIPDFDTKAADAEFATILRTARKALVNLGSTLGGLEEIMVGTANGIIIVRMIGSDYYTGIALGKNANIGMARLMQKKLVKEMYRRYYDDKEKPKGKVEP